MGFFGTDGVRGKFNQFPVTFTELPKIAIATCFLLKARKVLLGYDTRNSSVALSAALISGLLSIGVDVINVGIVPTPILAFLIKHQEADIGFVITASHNAYLDNGLKLFNYKGEKFDKNTEYLIEQLVLTLSIENLLLNTPKVGNLTTAFNAPQIYNAFIENQMGCFSLAGIKMVIDCANGSASYWYPYILQKLGVNLSVINNTPDGYNINNNCGALHPQSLQIAIQNYSANLGIAVDGDGDRLLICDENSKVIEGDQILGMLAKLYKEQKKLKSNHVVSNLLASKSLELFLQTLDINLIRTAPGDKYIAEKMNQIGSNIGGEPSGHYILSDYSATSDPVIALLPLLQSMLFYLQPISELSNNFKNSLKITKNFLKSKVVVDENFLNELAEKSTKSLEPDGRVILRKSGTEELIRLNIEGNDLKPMQLIYDDIVNSLKEYILS